VLKALLLLYLESQMYKLRNREHGKYNEMCEILCLMLAHGGKLEY